MLPPPAPAPAPAPTSVPKSRNDNGTRTDGTPLLGYDRCNEKRQKQIHDDGTSLRSPRTHIHSHPYGQRPARDLSAPASRSSQPLGAPSRPLVKTQSHGQIQGQQSAASSSTVDKSQQLFTCTFCWTLVSGPPHVLGRRSPRLACGRCYAALIDLAICWTCGEMVVRGEECVSLGWCFWHRACYGCLLCGSRLVVRGAKVRELFAGDDEIGYGENDSSATREWELGRRKGREVDEVPLCANCVVEVDLDGLDKRMVVQRAVRGTKRDIGEMGRRRWERVDRERESRAGNRPSAVTTVYEEASMEVEDKRDETQSNDGPIYVSVLDPIGGPTFKPSPTKPIPQWMWPFSHAADTAQQPRHGDELASLVAEKGKARQRKGSTNREMIRPEDLQEDDSLKSVPAISSTGPVSHNREPTTHRARSNPVRAEPLRLPSSKHLERVTSDANLSSSTLTRYHTAPEYPSPTPSAEMFPNIDYAGTSRTSRRTHVVPQPTSVAREDGTLNPLRKLGMLRDGQGPRIHHVPHPAQPLLSSEYLERYKLGKTDSVSSSSTTKRKSGIGAKLRRNSRAEVVITRHPTEAKEIPLADEPIRQNQTTYFSTNRRRSVQAELKRLFGR